MVTWTVELPPVLCWIWICVPAPVILSLYVLRSLLTLSLRAVALSLSSSSSALHFCVRFVFIIYYLEPDQSQT
jgi:hypothetical protein